MNQQEVIPLEDKVDQNTKIFHQEERLDPPISFLAGYLEKYLTLAGLQSKNK